MSLSETLKAIRESAGLTQEELAEKIGVQRNTVWRWENNRATMKADMLQSIAKALNVDSEQIMNSDKDKSIIHTRQQSKRESSLNRGMLVFETPDGKRFEAPATDIGMKYLEKMLAISMNNSLVVR